MNLDPFDQFSDKEIWTALENSHLSSFVSSLQDELNYAISEGGENLSVGQRQLLCLARALLKRKTQVCWKTFLGNAIFIRLVDPNPGRGCSRSGRGDWRASAEDDQVRQFTDFSLRINIFRESFKHCTVLTIAHRLNTVMDSDRMLVMDHGKAVEFDTPQNLLSDKNSLFHAMARDAGIV